jgi:putative ABC transport system permease protein
LETIWIDLRYALRSLLKSSGFTAVAVLTLALGIGANTAIFSVVQAVLLRSLPFKDPAHLLLVRESTGNGVENPVAYPNYLDWRAQNHVFENMAAYSDTEFIVSGNNSSERVFGEVVTDTYFSTLGVTASLGRTFLPEENQTPLKRAVTLIGYGLWQRRFGGDPSIAGKTLRLNDSDYTIVGVLPSGFMGFSDQAEAWIPVMMRDAAWPQSAKFNFIQSRDIHWLRVLARLKNGVSQQAARAEMNTIGAALAAAYPATNRQRAGVILKPVQQVYTRGFRTPLLLLLGAVGFVLLIACANVANLVLARAAARQRELAIRLALGAGSGQLIRQYLTESLLLAVGGAFAGVLFAVWGLQSLISLLPVTLPTFTKIHLDGLVLAFTSLLTIGVGIFLGLFPLFGAAHTNVNDSLKEGAKGTAGNRGGRIGSALVVCEVALALVLMIGAGLLLKSFARMLDVNPGFDADRLLTMRFYVPNRKFTGDGRNRFGPELAEKIAAMPGVESAAVTFIDPFVWGGFQRGFSIEGHAPVSNAEADSVYYQEVGPNYFHTMGIPITHGRDFSARDSRDAPGVVMVGEAFAARYWPGQNPLGKRLKYGQVDSKNPWMEVIGVVRDIKYNSIQQDPSAEPVLYGALLQSEVIINMSLIVRTRNAPEGMAASLRSEIQRIDPEIPVYNVATVTERLHKSSASTRSYAFLLTLFAALALGLSTTGIYTVITYWVTQRTREMGIRMALGAQQGNILRLVVGQGLRLAILGVILGLAAAFALTRAMTSILFEVSAFDPLIFTGLSGLISAIAVLACYLPARRGTRVDPIIALRYE